MQELISDVGLVDFLQRVHNAKTRDFPLEDCVSIRDEVLRRQDDLYGVCLAIDWLWRKANFFETKGRGKEWESFHEIVAAGKKKRRNEGVNKSKGISLICGAWSPQVASHVIGTVGGSDSMESRGKERLNDVLQCAKTWSDFERQARRPINTVLLCKHILAVLDTENNRRVTLRDEPGIQNRDWAALAEICKTGSCTYTTNNRTVTLDMSTLSNDDEMEEWIRDTSGDVLVDGNRSLRDLYGPRSGYYMLEYDQYGLLRARSNYVPPTLQTSPAPSAVECGSRPSTPGLTTSELSSPSTPTSPPFAERPPQMLTPQSRTPLMHPSLLRDANLTPCPVPSDPAVEMADMSTANGAQGVVYGLQEDFMGEASAGHGGEFPVGGQLFCTDDDPPDGDVMNEDATDEDANDEDEEGSSVTTETIAVGGHATVGDSDEDTASSEIEDWGYSEYGTTVDEASDANESPARGFFDYNDVRHNIAVPSSVGVTGALEAGYAATGPPLTQLIDVCMLDHDWTALDSGQDGIIPMEATDAADATDAMKRTNIRSQCRFWLRRVLRHHPSADSRDSFVPMVTSLIHEERPVTIEGGLCNRYHERLVAHVTKLQTEAAATELCVHRAQWLSPKTQWARIYALERSGLGEGLAAHVESADVQYCHVDQLVDLSNEPLSKPTVIKESFNDPHDIDVVLGQLQERYRDSNVPVHDVHDSGAKTVSINTLVEAMRVGTRSILAENLGAAVEAHRPVSTTPPRFQLLDVALARTRNQPGKDISAEASSVRNCLSFSSLGCAGAFTGMRFDAFGGVWLRNLADTFLVTFVPCEAMSEEWVELEAHGSDWAPNGKERMIVVEHNDVVFIPAQHIYTMHVLDQFLAAGGVVWDEIGIVTTAKGLHRLGRIAYYTHVPLASQLKHVVEELQKMMREDPGRFARHSSMEQLAEAVECLRIWGTTSGW